MKIAQIEAKLIDSMGTDLSVVNAARVSFDKESEWYTDPEAGPREGILSVKDEKLINYLAKHKHFSPFNHTFLTFRVKAPIFVARQLVKHKFMPWNEVSRRYVDSEPEFYIPDDYRLKADNVKQGSSDKTINKFINPWSFEEGLINNVHVQHLEASLILYNGLLASGICAEQARMVLPQNTMTEWMWSGTLGAYADMLKLRLDPHTQYESRIVAQQIEKQIYVVFPVSLKALLENK